MSTQVIPIVVLGSWSCGSTAVTGYLERAGAYSPRPRQPTTDPRTPDSHEPKALRDALVDRVDELSLRPRDNSRQRFRSWVSDWLEHERQLAARNGRTHVVIKHPLLAFYIADLHALFGPRFVIVTREHVRIEASRRHRGWHPVYGRQGARILYNAIFGAFTEHTLSALICHYAEFRRDAALRERLCSWVDLRPDPDQVAEAEQWLR